jgi:hypothetical protein
LIFAFVRGVSGRCLAAALLCAASPAWSQDLPGSIEVVRDFMIQDVCLDRAGMVVIGHAPIAGDPACVARRDLFPGERLPYHKHDHRTQADARAGGAASGYQRHDGFPVETATFGDVIVQSFDFGGGDRRFGRFDDGKGDGGDIVVLSPYSAAIGATDDGGAGFQLFVGAGCRDRVTPGAIADSWIVALLNPVGPLRGETVAQLKDLKRGQQGDCPPRLNQAYTRWQVQPVTFRAASGQGTPVTLATLVSDHFGGGDPRSADHLERFYFTRELGPTRWERWQDRARSRDADKQAAEMGASGRCSAVPPPAENPALVMVDCREWSSIQPPDEAHGDAPSFFAQWATIRPEAAALFPPQSPR